MSQLPEWAADAIKTYATALNLNHWRIEAVVEQCIDDDPDTMAQCEQFNGQTRAVIHLRSDMEDTQEWRITILHEMLHVAHAHVDAMLQRVIFPHLPEAARVMADAAYRETYEPFVDSLATSFYLALRGEE